ncbi:MAG: hypothetical protein ABIP74_04350 [Candidatus Saccharimonas sp.]
MGVGQYYRKGVDDVWRSPGRPALGSTFVAFTPGVVMPVGELDVGLGARNVGPRPEVTLTPYYGDLVLTSGQEVSGLDIHGVVTTNAALGTPAYVHDCIIRGNNTIDTAGTGTAIGHNYDLSGTVFEWCRLDATGNENGFLDGITGGGFTVRYCEILRGVDGIHLTQGNVTAECCRIYYPYYFAWWDDGANAKRTTSFTDYGGTFHSTPFPNQGSGDVHGDGIQVAGSSGNIIRGCYIGGERGSATGTNIDPTIQADYNAMVAHDTAVGFKNAAIIVNAISANPIGALIEKNWLHGGSARLNLSINGSDLLGGLTVQNNRFMRSGYGFYIYAQTGNTATISNNVYDDTNGAVPIVNW